MREKKLILEFIESRSDAEYILVTLLNTKGSTYKFKNAQKLIALNSESCGIISGGCLEHEIVSFAQNMKNMTEIYTIDTSSLEDRFLGSSLGCQGVLELEFKRLSKNELLSDAYFGAYKNEEQKLHIFGAGADTEPLNDLLDWLKWDYCFYSHNDSNISLRVDKNWPIKKIDFSTIQNDINKRSQNYIVLMTHNYNTDLEILDELYPFTNIQFIGLLGPTKRKDLLIQDLERIYGKSLTNEMQEKIYGPIGLPGFGKGETAVALSITGQLQSLFFKNDFNHHQDL